MGYSFTGTVGGAVVSVSTAEADVAIIPDFDGDGIPDIILSSAWKPVPGHPGNTPEGHPQGHHSRRRRSHTLDALDGVLTAIFTLRSSLTGSGPRTSYNADVLRSRRRV